MNPINPMRGDQGPRQQGPTVVSGYGDQCTEFNGFWHTECVVTVEQALDTVRRFLEWGALHIEVRRAPP